MVVYFLDIVVGTAFIFDLFYGKIPNTLMLFAYITIPPVLFWEQGVGGAGSFGMAAVVLGGVYILIYMFRGIGAGDVKLLTLISGVFGIKYGFRFLVVVFFLAGFYGVGRMLMALKPLEGGDIRMRLQNAGKIRFMIPVLAGYMFVLFSICN